jgi:hypothetical protein
MTNHEHLKRTGHEMVVDAIQQAQSHCQLMMEQEDYTPIALRGVLYTLGFTTSEADEVIEYCRREGFNYCIDPMVPTKDANSGEYRSTPEFACYWGPDQLLSRLHWVYRS